MSQTAIPFILMRGGSSRGPYFNSNDLPDNKSDLANVLINVIGSGHALNINGIGGGNPVTTKVAILSKSSDAWADIDYFFAQVSVEDKTVDFKPTCGNILSGVAAAAVEMGLYPAQKGQTAIKIRAVNTEAKISSIIETDGQNVIYDGDTEIDGVPGTASAVKLNFRDVEGSSTGAFLPTGCVKDVINGVSVTCMDVAVPMVIARAASFGLTGHETSEVLDANKGFFKRMEALRLKAGKMMGMGDVRKSVTPKFGLIAPAINNEAIAARYFMPWSTHPTMAVTGSQCIASCILTPGSVADGIIDAPENGPLTVTLEHPMGSMDVTIDYSIKDGNFNHLSAGLIRSCRKLAQGEVFIPSTVWSN